MSFEAEQTAREALRQDLGSDERLLWSGMPRQGVRLRASDAMMIPFSLMWGGFSFFWEYMVVQSHAGPFFTLWGIPFVVMGVYLIAGRFFVDSAQRARTFYGLTDQRVLIVGGLMGRSTRSVALGQLGEVVLDERPDGSGTISFGATSGFFAMWRGTSWPGMGNRMTPCFDLIDDARRVHGLIRDAENARASR